MSTEGGTKAAVAALLANLGIAIMKFIAFFMTGFSSMLAEAIHSVADSGNQVLLLFGGKRARREATPNTLRIRTRALCLRVHRLHSAVHRRWPVRLLRGVPEGTKPTTIRASTRSKASGGGCRSSFLAVAIVLESFSFRTAIVESNKVRGKRSCRGSSSAVRRRPNFLSSCSKTSRPCWV